MNEKARLEQKLYELRFAITELVLFLDTHPESKKALSLLQSYRMMYTETLENLRHKYGDVIITNFDSNNETHWDWINGPWPWENAANTANTEVK